MSARAHAERGLVGESRSRHWRSGSTSWTAATAASAAEREPNGPAYRAPSVGDGAHDGQARERLDGELDPQGLLGVAGAAVVAGLVLGDEPQLAHLGLEGGRADDRADRLGDADHLAHPAAVLGGREVGAHAGADGDRRADVEDVPLPVLEEVDAGRRRAGRRRGGACGAGRGRPARCSRAAPRGSARRASRPARGGRAGRRRSPGRRAGRGGRASSWPGRGGRGWPSRWLGASSRCTSWRARCTVSSTGKPGHSCSVRRAAALRKEMSKPALCATSTEPAANSRNAGQRRLDAGSPGDHGVGDAREHRDERRDGGARG